MSKTSFKNQLERIFKENIYDDHENCDDSCGKKAEYTDLITSIINLVDKELPRKKPLDKEQGVSRYSPGGVDMWGNHYADIVNGKIGGYNQAIDDMRAIIRSNT